MIPQYDLSPEYAERMILRLRSCGVKKVHLLPFHRLGSGKYQLWGVSIPVPGWRRRVRRTWSSC